MLEHIERVCLAEDAIGHWQPAQIREHQIDVPPDLGREIRTDVDAHELGALTLSVLRGEDGHQAKELAKLIAWLGEFRPELVQLANALFLGMAGPIRRALGVPVVCGLTGEDLFLDSLEEPWHGEVLAELRRRAADADGFLAPGVDYDKPHPYLKNIVDKIDADGYVHLPKGPGMGYEIVWDYIDDNLVEPLATTKKTHW